jgi:hypothetical protein
LIHQNYPELEAIGCRKGAVQILGEDRSLEAKVGRICEFESLIEVGVRSNGDNWTENLASGHTHLRRYVGQHGRL